MQGEVKISFATLDYAFRQFPTPIPPQDDPEYVGTTCLQIE